MLTEILHNDSIRNVDKMSTQYLVWKEVKKVVDTQMLEDIISNSGKKKTYLADKIGISVQNLRMKMNNNLDFKSGEVAILCEELGITQLTRKEKIFFKK